MIVQTCHDYPDNSWLSRPIMTIQSYIDKPEPIMTLQSYHDKVIMRDVFLVKNLFWTEYL